MEGWIEKIGTLITPVTAPVRATAAV
jgi:hypothetical protein